MLVARVLDDSEPRFAVVEGDSVELLESFSIDGVMKRTGRRRSLSSVELLVPVKPSKIIGIGINYQEHLEEAKQLLPHHKFGDTVDEVMFGLRAPSVLIGPGRPIVIPAGVKRLDHEAELGVVIGRQGRYIPKHQALDHVFGYVCYNDCGARDIQMRGPSYAQRAKSFDSLGACGPWIATEVDLASASLRCVVNGEVRQEASLGSMIFGVADVIAEVSRFMTLFPGDLIVTGSPAGVSGLQAGDTVEVEVEGIGTLSNPVSAETEQDAGPVPNVGSRK